MDRLVLCRPQGGLNDVLCQIERVCRYAEQFDRKVIIDTNHHSTASIKDHFSRYFASRQKRVILDLTEVPELKNTSVVPRFLASDPHQYDAYFDRELGYFVETNTRQPITFDFKQNYAEPLLVHHASGRLPGASVGALSRLSLHNVLSDELTKRFNAIGPNYVSVHIRNTDYQTNCQPLLGQLKNHPALRKYENLFVATDDIACLEFCRNLFTGMNIVSYSDLPEESGCPIHRLSDERNKSAILDLLMLALSHKFFFFEINRNRWGTRYSGFSLLALDLRDSKTTLEGLISRAEIDISHLYRNV